MKQHDHPLKSKLSTAVGLSRHDWILIGTIIALFSLRMVIMTSASIAMAERKFGQPFYYTLHQGVCLLMGLTAMGLFMRMPD